MIEEKIIGNIGVIYLNRPKQLNALSLEDIINIKKILRKWEEDDNINAVLFDSKLEKGFSAGGDIKQVYVDYLINDDINEKDIFFKTEFDLDKYVKNYNKPTISHWFGVTMGGGIGLTVFTDFIITDESVNWAMPETILGFTPDVGVGKVISSFPQAIGQYVGLTGASLEASDLIRLGVADLYINSNDYEKITDILFDLSKEYEANDLIDKLKEKTKVFSKDISKTNLEKNEEEINKYFSHHSLEKVYEDLKANENKEFAKNCLKELDQRDPFMLNVQFEKYFACKNLSQEEVLDLDLKIIQYAVKVGSIREGIRARIIDKDDNPNWPVKSIDDVDISKVKEILDIKKTYKEKLEN